MKSEDTFIRGQTFEVLLDLPSDVPPNYFENSSTSTDLVAAVRKRNNPGASGLIAHLEVSWEPGSDYHQLRVLAEDTANWALGPVEFDVVFTRTVLDSGTGLSVSKTYRSMPVKFTILNGVTR